jgi:hypothetical protein
MWSGIGVWHFILFLSTLSGVDVNSAVHMLYLYRVVIICPKPDNVGNSEESEITSEVLFWQVLHGDSQFMIWELTETLQGRNAILQHAVALVRSDFMFHFYHLHATLFDVRSGQKRYVIGTNQMFIYHINSPVYRQYHRSLLVCKLWSWWALNCKIRS